MAENKKPDKSGTDRLLDAARLIRSEVTERADGFLEGKYNPGDEIKGKAVKATTTAILIASLLTGLSFSGPAELNEDQASSQLRPAPIVMDIDDYMNTSVNDDDDADEQKSAKPGFIARFKQAVLSLPSSVRLLIITPLWAIGTAMMTVVSFLWNIIFSSPLGAFIASFAVGFAVLFGLFAVTAKMLFPDVPLRKILSKRNVLVLGIAALLLAVIDWLAPMYWHQYPAVAAAVKLGTGAFVIGVICYRVNKLLHREKYTNLPEAAV